MQLVPLQSGAAKGAVGAKKKKQKQIVDFAAADVVGRCTLTPPDP
jgi:hypothetical protein